MNFQLSWHLIQSIYNHIHFLKFHFFFQLINPIQLLDVLPYTFDWIVLECECMFGSFYVCIYIKCVGRGNGFEFKWRGNMCVVVCLGFIFHQYTQNFITSSSLLEHKIPGQKIQHVPPYIMKISSVFACKSCYRSLRIKWKATTFFAFAWWKPLILEIQVHLLCLDASSLQNYQTLHIMSISRSLCTNSCFKK